MSTIMFILGLAALLTCALPGYGRGASSLREKMVEEAKKEGAVVIAGSVVDDMARHLTGFKKRYPFIAVKDIEMNTKDTVNRVVAEAKAGRLTVDWAGISEDGSEIFVRQEVLAKLELPHLQDFAPGSQPPHGLYVGGLGNPRPQAVYNTDLVKPHEVPKNWDELVDPKWKGKVMLSRSGEEIPGRLAWLWRDGNRWDWERAFDLYRKIKALEPAIGRGYSGGAQRVAAGEIALFYFAPATVAGRLALKGAPMSIVAFPKLFSGVRGWNVFKGAPHPASAWLLMDYLTSPEGQFEFTEKVAGFVPLNLKAKAGKMGHWMIERGATLENSEIVDLGHLDEIYSPKVQEKSSEFFFSLLGLR